MSILFLVFMLVMLFPQHVCAESEPLDFTYGNVDPTEQGDKGTPRCPMAMPSVSIDGAVLYFTTSHPKYHLILLDENGEIVFEQMVLENTSLVELPLNLTGCFKIVLQQNQKKFLSTINI